VQHGFDLFPRGLKAGRCSISNGGVFGGNLRHQTLMREQAGGAWTGGGYTISGLSGPTRLAFEGNGIFVTNSTANTVTSRARAERERRSRSRFRDKSDI
jgi:hypothetical protein